MLLQSLLRPVLTPIMRGIFDPAQSVSAAWSPLSLWPDGIDSPGMWISPRTLTSQWQDYTGTTPVSVPGTVADTSNPVGLALDIRAGGIDNLGPELIVGAPSTIGGNWVNNGDGTFTGIGGSGYLAWESLSEINNRLISFRIVSRTAGSVAIAQGVGFQSTPGTYSCILDVGVDIAFYGNAFEGVIDSISAKPIPGNHMLQSTSAARPLLSAYDGQTLGPGNTYDSAGYPVFQLYDGVDDGMATAAFSAGTLINGMDCQIPLRRDSAAACVAGLYNGIADATKFFGMAESGSGSGCVGSGAGTPTVWVDGVQLSGGTAVTRGTLHTALTVGDYHILEFRGLDLSTWTAAGFGLYTSYLFNGARGDIMLYPSTDPTEDKDAARQWLADYYGVTLP